MEISFVIPVYNSEKSIGKCLDSILKNNCNEIEVICVNDGSTDKSLDILYEYANIYNYIRVISKENEGPFIARKIGIEYATKKYVTFVDSDDWIEDTYLSKVENIINHKDIDILAFQYINDYSNGNSNKSSINLENRLYLKKEFKHHIYPILMSDGNFNGMCNKIFKRELLLNNHVDYKFNYGEDLIFQLNVFNRANNIFFMKESIYHYTHYRENSLSNAKQEIDLLLDMYNMRKQYSDRWQLNNEILNKPFLILICMCFLTAMKNNNAKSLFKILTSIEIMNAINITSKITSESKNILLIYKYLRYWFKIYTIYHCIKSYFFYFLKKTILPMQCFFKKLRLKNDNFTILTSTCAGGIIYHRLGKKFLSPTINLWMTELDLLKFVSDIPKYQNAKLKFFKSDEFDYPVAKLEDITIYFNHANTEEDAVYQWMHRKDRINMENLFILASDHDIAYEDMIKFSNINCRGLAIFTSKDYPGLEYTLQLKYIKNRRNVGEYIGDHTAVLDKFKWEKYFDYVHWLNTGKIRK